MEERPGSPIDGCRFDGHDNSTAQPPASLLGKLRAAVESEFRTDVLKLGADEPRPCCDVPVEHQPVLARCVAEAAHGQSIPTG